MWSSTNNDNGLTLIELIAAITILGVLTGILAHTVAFWNGLGEKSRRVLQRQNELQTVFTSIIDGSGGNPGLLVAKDVTVTGASDPCALTDPEHKGTLAFVLPNDTTVTYRYSELAKSLYRKVGADDETAIQDSLTCFSTKQTLDGIVLLRIRSTVNGVGGPRVVELATEVKPRNLTP